MPLRNLSGRPRHVQVLIISLLVLVIGVAAGIGRASDPSTPLETAVAYADEFVDIPPSTTPAVPETATTAPADTTTTAPAVPPAERAAEAITPQEAPPAPSPAEVAAPPAPAKPILPLGKGMWLYQLSMSEGGNATKVVNKAKALGLTHLYTRLGSSKKGFYAQEELNKLLPVAHAAGIKVIGWDFVYLTDPIADAVRSKAEIDYTTPDGHKIDAFSADIESPQEGVNLTAEGAALYGAKLRELVGPSYPLIATVPRPSPKKSFPFAEVTAAFDAIAPMVYWQNRDPATDVAGAIDYLAQFNKPIMPIGQAYNGGPEGGPDRDPPKSQLVDFMNTAHAKGAVAVSFWVWNHATPEQFAAIDEAIAWELPIGRAANGAAAVFLQRVLNLLGQPVAQDGKMGPATTKAIAALQTRFGLPATGNLDATTARLITGPQLV
ncbi:MAG TPA: peptidoglycan-binding domain-containing protein [Acidimicrobiia bacterium]|nr:peptidoglycan-binding domain-containing protein [Acidimicrobiia bacterium]